MHVIGKDNPGVDAKRRTAACLPNRVPQCLDLCHQQVGTAVEQVHVKKNVPTGTRLQR
jgi:hypothetical protein